jgi:hypothetical protein
MSRCFPDGGDGFAVRLRSVIPIVTPTVRQYGSRAMTSAAVAGSGVSRNPARGEAREAVCGARHSCGDEIALEAVAVIRPWVRGIAVATYFPEARFVVLAEIQGSEPFDRLPAVALGHD